MKHDNLIKWIEAIERRINGAISSITSLVTRVTVLEVQPFAYTISEIPTYTDSQTITFIVTGKGFGNNAGNISVLAEDLNGNSFAVYFTINSISIVYNDNTISINTTIGDLPGGSTSSVHFKITVGTNIIYSPIFEVTG